MRFWHVVFWLVFLAGPGEGSDPVGPSAPWPLDEVLHMNGAKFHGLILSENEDGSISFRVVSRQPGRPTVTLRTKFLKGEVAAIRRLNDSDRAALQARLAELDPTGATERAKMDQLSLLPTQWLDRPNSGLRYDSDRFILISGAPEPVTRRAAVRLEQVYAAFTRLLPPRYPAARPTMVFLAGRLTDYAQLVGTTGVPLLNLAVYDPRYDRILCGSDLIRLGNELVSISQRHREQLIKLEKYEAEVRQLYRNSPGELDRFIKIVVMGRQRLRDADRMNDRRFDETTERLFAILAHEAFHSYAATFLYPPRTPEQVRQGEGTGELPRWLNEGLAQIFETAVIEAAELHVGHADVERLKLVKDRLQGKGEPPGLLQLTDLIRAGKDSFLATHADRRGNADRAYLTSWAVAMYLTFDRRLIGGENFDNYLTSLNSGTDPLTAFEQWTGEPLATFEKNLKQYLERLRPDGSLAPN